MRHRNRNFEIPEEGIRIYPGEDGRVIVHLPYTPDRVNQIRTVPGRVWDHKKKRWSVPHTDTAIQDLLTLFKGEHIEIDSSLQPSNSTKSNQQDDLHDLSCLEDMEKELKLGGAAYKTRKAYLGHARRFIKFCAKDPRSLGEADLRQYARHLLESGQSHSTVNQCISAVKFFFRKVLKYSSTIVDIPRPKKEQKLPNILSREEILRFFKAVVNPKHRALLMVVYSSALRVGEAVRLQLRDIDTDRRLIHIRQAKGRKDRYVMLSDVAQRAIEVYCKAFNPAKWLFPGQREGRHLTERTVLKVVHQVCERASINKGTAVHTLRHSCATHLLESGTDLRYIQELLGHKSPKTTQIYTRVSKKNIARIRSPLDDIMEA